jgi:hypothetical protein
MVKVEECGCASLYDLGSDGFTTPLIISYVTPQPGIVKDEYQSRSLFLLPPV